MSKARFILVVFLAFSLISCAAKSSFEKEEDQKRIKTAKINAQLGIAYLEQNNVQRSKQKLLRAMDQAPDIPEAWYSMAYFLEATGNKNEAASYYRKAIAVAPDRGDAKNNYGTFLCRTGRYHESIDQFLLAVEDHNYLDPADAYENAGICALKAPDRQLAENYFKKALAEDPARPVSILKLAEILYQNKSYKDARAHLDEFLAISPPTTASQRLAGLLILQENGVLANQETVKKIKAPRSRLAVRVAQKKPLKSFKAKSRKKLAAKKSDKKKKVIAKKRHHKHKQLAGKKAKAKKIHHKHKQLARKNAKAKKIHRTAAKNVKAKHIAKSKAAKTSKKIAMKKKTPVKKKSPSTIARKKKVTVPLRPSPEKKYYHEHNVLAQNDSLAQGMLIT